MNSHRQVKISTGAIKARLSLNLGDHRLPFVFSPSSPSTSSVVSLAAYTPSSGIRSLEQHVPRRSFCSLGLCRRRCRPKSNGHSTSHGQALLVPHWPRTSHALFVLAPADAFPDSRNKLTPTMVSVDRRADTTSATPPPKAPTLCARPALSTASTVCTLCSPSTRCSCFCRLVCLGPSHWPHYNRRI